MKINFITPGLSRQRFSGGIYCILKHADALARRGHEVNVIPLFGGRRPEWIDCSANFLINEKPVCHERKKYKCHISAIDRALFGTKGLYTKRAIQLNHMSGAIPPADITIATEWITAESVYRFGTGKKAFYMQHFESVFFEPATMEHYQCEWTYQLPLARIANSGWLQQTMTDYLHKHAIHDRVYRAINAVDLDIYRRMDIDPGRKHAKHVRLISYGGRGVRWKGMEEMTEAVAIARSELPDWELEWSVYGDASIPPGNAIASYNHLGFLPSVQLAEAYNRADILLSASWYESFPLFPIEGMACGLATITTQPGTEDYAIHQETVEIVEPQNPRSVADAIKRLATDSEYRHALAERGHAMAQQMSWTNASKRLEATLLEIIQE
jgi:glycosyltransferase involved in cell wall biosynthesis